VAVSNISCAPPTYLGEVPCGLTEPRVVKVILPALVVPASIHGRGPDGSWQRIASRAGGLRSYNKVRGAHHVKIASDHPLYPAGTAWQQAADHITSNLAT
jgi:hypothetical protein